MKDLENIIWAMKNEWEDFGWKEYTLCAFLALAVITAFWIVN
jgi:hypothetical protein